MNAEALLVLRPALDRFLKDFDDCAVAPTRRHIATYVQGQLGPLPRKSIEPMALNAGVHPRNLQELLSLHRWDEDLMRTRIHRRVKQRSHSGPHAIGVIDETSYLKKGDKTPGVQRQYCGTTGKTDNCVVTVHLGVADGDFHALLESELYLPNSWANDRTRCRAAGIPDDRVYRPKTDIALELIDRATQSDLEFGWLTFDEGYGGKPPFLAALLQRGHRYIGEIPKNFMGWFYRPEVVEVEEAPSVGRPRHIPRLADGAARSRPVEELACQIDLSQKRTYSIKETHKGPEVWHVGSRPFYPQIEGLPGPVHWLIVAIPVTGEKQSTSFPMPLPASLWRFSFTSPSPAGTLSAALRMTRARSGWIISRFATTAPSNVISSSPPSASFSWPRPMKSFGGKNPDWTLCQVKLAIEAQLEPGLTRKQRLRRLAKPARIISYYQWRNRNARRSHRKSALRRLRAIGIRVSQLPSCVCRL